MAMRSRATEFDSAAWAIIASPHSKPTARITANRRRPVRWTAMRMARFLDEMRGKIIAIQHTRHCLSVRPRHECPHRPVRGPDPLRYARPRSEEYFADATRAR